MKYQSIHYEQYLQLEKILKAQHLKSEEHGVQAHEEMLFIITHQVYELWFKQIIHELESIHFMFNNNEVDEERIGVAVGRLNRVITIMHLLIEQIKIMETMTPLDFLDFRHYLFPASGFQSFQFRKMEVLLGLKYSERYHYQNIPYYNEFVEEKREELLNLESGKSLLTLISNWLERTPFLQISDFHFLNAYQSAVKAAQEKERKGILESDILQQDEKESRIKALEHAENHFRILFDRAFYASLMHKGELKLSYEATLAALFINVYREEPILQLPYQFLSKLIEIDELLTTWRYRHAQMVMRMLGRKTGTGGSSGHDYLKKTAEKHHIFADLHHVSTFLISRTLLPELPPSLKKKLSFYFTST